MLTEIRKIPLKKNKDPPSPPKKRGKRMIAPRPTMEHENNHRNFDQCNQNSISPNTRTAQLISPVTSQLAQTHTISILWKFGKPRYLTYRQWP